MTEVIEWWNLGRNIRVPDENRASWVQLLKDDFSQLTYSDSAFVSGSRDILSLRPFKAFSPKMVSTGPTPLVRQIVERPIRFIKSSLL